MPQELDEVDGPDELIEGDLDELTDEDDLIADDALVLADDDDADAVVVIEEEEDENLPVVEAKVATKPSCRTRKSQIVNHFVTAFTQP